MKHENDEHDQQQNRLDRLGPMDFDLNLPGESFWVGDYEYVVEVGNPLIPAIVLRLSENGPSMLANFLFLYPALWLAWRIESRARVAIFRRTGHRYFRMVHIEYVPDVEVGERRQVEIRKTWAFGDHQSSRVLKLRDVFSAYRAARREIPRVNS